MKLQDSNHDQGIGLRKNTQWSGFLQSWPLKMAWRDSRKHRKRLFLFVSSIVFGVAALVAITSFGENLETAINDQAKALLGADMMLSGRQPFAPETEALIDSIGGEQAREILFASMAYFPKTVGTRLVQVRALQGDFPFYGRFGTEPREAATRYKTGPHALVDEVLMIQFQVNPGDSIRIGSRSYDISGRLVTLPSEPPIASTFSPRVYLPLHYLDKANLLQRGSLVTYRVYFKFDDQRDVEKLVAAIKPKLRQQRVYIDTVEKRKEQLGEIMGNLYRFLNLVGFVALILGSIGVASAVHVYVNQKRNDIAILRCVGARAKQTVLIYLTQITTMALSGSVLGALLGLTVQIFLPDIFKDFLPVQVEATVAWNAIWQGVLVGLSVALVFALLPLISIRKVSPLRALRSSYESGSILRKDKLRWFMYLLVLVASGAFAILQARNWQMGLWFILGIWLALAVLAAVAKLISVLFRKFFPKSWPYVWRQGLANLYRPNNQTLILMLAIGLGTFLITTLYLSHDILLRKVTYVGGEDRPNLILFDVQPDQQEQVVDIVRSHHLPIMQQAPIVTMRLDSLKGRSVAQILSDSTRHVSRGLLSWEYRTTYREYLLDSETIVAGQWEGKVAGDGTIVPVSLESDAAERLGVTVGDTIVWNVQGLPLRTVVGSLRKVDWQRIQANFMAVFPEGALNSAPKVYVLATRTSSARASADLQRAVVQSFPNVSIIDLKLVLTTLDSFLRKISFVIRFMAFFSMFTGLIVLIAAVTTSRYQRIQESVLLRTLGASRKQIIKIMIIEYLFLGAFAALTGLILSYAGGCALAYFVFDSVFVPTVLPFASALLAVIALTVLIGMGNSRGILERPPLEVLRAEA